MYFRTLKKDLKRQKTMNIILLLFTVIASMFVSSGMSNVVSVMNGTEYFMSKAGVGDHMIFTQKGDGGVEEILKKSPNVTGYRVEHCYWVDREAVMVDDRIVDSVNNILIVQSIQDSGISLFDRYNKKLEKVNKGEVYVTTGFLKRNNVNIGDVLTIHLGGTERAFKITGEFKDALFGSNMMGNTRLVINEEEFAEYENNEKLDEFSGRMFNIETDDLNKLVREVSSAKNVLFSAGKDTFKLCYIMEMISAFVVFVLSVCLVVVSFVLLKFVISFSITEEYREIGVMKAIGIRNSRIRNIYIIKYFVIALIGGIIGFVLGIPFSNVLIASVSEKMVLGNDSGIAINMTGSTIVVLVMIGFVYMCTGKIKKVTPVDAIRNGQTGERYKKKRRHSIQKSHFGNAFYMAINDVLSSPKRYVTIILAFFICSIFVFGLVETTDTMKSDRLIRTFCKKSDVYINDTKLVKWTDISKEGNKNIENTVKNLEDDLVEMGMPGKVAIEVWYNYPILFEGDTLSFTFQQNKKAKASDYDYTEGIAPQNADEIAITSAIAKKLDAHIGDKVIIDFGSEKRECIITAYFQTMNQLGEVIRLHEDAPTDMESASGIMAYQVDFNDKIDSNELARRIERIKEHYDIESVFDSAGYCNDCMRVADSMDAISKMLLLITCIVVVLTTVLMERSFIKDEENQIALLKALGFSDGFVIRWHCERFMIVALISELMAVVLTYPVTKLWCDPIWNMMGAQNVDYYFKPISLIVIYPGIILFITLVTAWLTSMHTRSVKSRDITNIE